MNSIWRTAASFILLLAITSSQSARADEQVLCAHVYPCNADGSVQAPYNEGDCRDYYERICFTKVYNELSGELVSCETEKGSYEKKHSQALKRLRKLRRRALKR